MSQPAPATIISHWYNLIGSFTYSTQDYYQQIEAAVSQLQIPDLKVSRVEWKEGGMFSAKREYLRIRRDRLVFDVCGAPFGTGYFVSWWLGELKGANIFMVLGVIFGFFIVAMLAISLLGTIFSSILGGFIGMIFMFLSIPFVFFLLALFIRQNPMGIEDTIMDIPFIGPLYERLFRPVTYYKVDTALMFQSAIHSSVLQVVDMITQAQGVRALTAEERKPIMREFYQK
jgi:hypothetical protein